MKKKWYFGTLLSALALFVVIQQQAVVPNQEIVLEFVHNEVSSTEAQNAVSIVKKQLQSIGVQYTRITRGFKKGTFKIAYYSDEDVAYIKRILSEEENLTLDHVFYDHHQDEDQSPSDEKSKEYNLNVYEIHKNTDFDTNINNKYVLEVVPEQYGNSNTSLYGFLPEIDINITNRLTKTAYKINTNIALAIDTTSHTIPEVRAGPIT